MRKESRQSVKENRRLLRQAVPRQEPRAIGRRAEQLGPKPIDA